MEIKELYIIIHESRGFFGGFNGFGTLYTKRVANARFFDNLEGAENQKLAIREKNNVSIFKLEIDMKEVK